MENILDPNDKQCMKMAILKHEETFREQVYELHRLYQIQKILMKNTTSSSSRRSNFNNSATTDHQINDHLDTSRKILQGLDLERPAEEYNQNNADKGIVGMVDSSELELTLGPSSFYRRRKEADHASPTLPSDISGPSFSSSSCASSHIKESSSNSQKWRMEMPMAAAPGFHGERKKSSSVDEQLIQDNRINNNPPWLFQVLSLNIT